MRPACQLWAFNAEVTAPSGIVPPPRSHSWPTVLVFLFGMLGEAAFESVPLSPSVTSIRRGQPMSPSSLDLLCSSSDIPSSSAWALGLI